MIMWTGKEHLLLERIKREGHYGSTSAPERKWEVLRVSLEDKDPCRRREAAATAARFWRALPNDEKGQNIRLLSGIRICYFLEKNRTDHLDVLSDRFSKMSKRLGVVALEAESQIVRGLSLIAAGRISEAVHSLELGKALFGSTNENAFDVVRASTLLASAFRLTGDRASAISILNRAREICLLIEEVPLLGSVTQTLGMNYLETGDLSMAMNCFEFSRLSSEQIGAKRRALRANLGLTMTFLRMGRFGEAQNLSEESLDLAQHLELPREICLAHEFLGESYVHQSHWAKGLWHFSRAMKCHISSHTTADIGVELHRRLSEFWLSIGNLKRAALHQQKGVDARGGEREDHIALERVRLELEWLSQNTFAALENLRNHAESTRQNGFGYEYLVTCERIVRIADKMNQYDLAAEWWARVEFLAKSCGAEPLLERWRKERQEKGYLPQTSSDGLDGEPGPNARLAQELPRVDLGAYNIITRSRQLHEQAASVGQVAQTTVPVLIHGESGTGKELFAKLVHDLSPRKSDAFLAVNCGALPSELLESELFGHRRGSFTGAINDKPGLFRAAHKGTLFLDEIGEMTAPAQTKLLRVLEAGELRRVGDTQVEFVDVRIVAATNVDLEREVKSGKFRQDLYYRLKGLEVFLPPLRERMSDIPLLADYFLNRANQLCHKQLVLPFETKQWLMGLPWHGNVRELRLAVERATALGPQTGMLQPYHFMGAEQAPSKSSLNAELEEIERSRVLHALDACKWNKAAAAKLLGMSRTTLGGKIKRLGIDDLDSRD